MTMPKLAPCPVCGSEPSHKVTIHSHSIRCVGLDHVNHVYGSTKREAIAKWNSAFKEKTR